MIEVYKMVTGLCDSEVDNITNMWHEETERRETCEAIQRKVSSKTKNLFKEELFCVINDRNLEWIAK